MENRENLCPNVAKRHWAQVRSRGEPRALLGAHVFITYNINLGLVGYNGDRLKHYKIRII